VFLDKGLSDGMPRPVFGQRVGGGLELGEVTVGKVWKKCLGEIERDFRYLQVLLERRYERIVDLLSVRIPCGEVVGRIKEYSWKADCSSLYLDW
jgi:hypothetical protein